MSNNPALENAVSNGVVAGYAASRYTAPKSLSVYAELVTIAAAFAALVDAKIPFDALLTQSKVNALTGIVSGVFATRYQKDTSMPDYDDVAEGIVNLYTAETTVLDPAGNVGGGGGFWQYDAVNDILKPILAQSSSSLQTSGGFVSAAGISAFATTYGTASGNQSFAAGGSSSNGDRSTAVSGGYAGGSYDFSHGPGSIANSGAGLSGSAAFCDGATGADGAFAVGGSATGNHSYAFGSLSLAAGAGAFAHGGGVANGDFSVALVDSTANGYGSLAGGGTAFATGIYSVALAGGQAVHDFDFASGLGSIASGGGLGAGATAFGGGQAGGDGSFAAGIGSQAYDALGVTVVGATAFGGGIAEADAAFSCSGGIAYDTQSFAHGGGSEAHGLAAFAASGGRTGQVYDTAVSEGNASGQASFAANLGSYATGLYSSAFCGGAAQGVNDFAAGLLSVANNGLANPVYGAVAITGSSALADGAFAASGGFTNGARSVAIGSCNVPFPSSYKIGDDAGSYFWANSDGFGSAEVRCGATQILDIENVQTQFGVGAAGAAQAVPASPDLYLVLTINGTPYAFPGFAII